MGEDIRGYQSIASLMATVGSDAGLTWDVGAVTEKVLVRHITGSPAWLKFGSGITPYGNGSGTLLLTNGDAQLELPVRTQYLAVVGSTGSPIGASTATLQFIALR